eukprot:1137785-Pelagomonas_calceolata.AAC.4
MASTASFGTCPCWRWVDWCWESRCVSMHAFAAWKVICAVALEGSGVGQVMGLSCVCVCARMHRWNSRGDYVLMYMYTSCLCAFSGTLKQNVLVRMVSKTACTSSCAKRVICLAVRSSGLLSALASNISEQIAGMDLWTIAAIFCGVVLTLLKLQICLHSGPGYTGPGQGSGLPFLKLHFLQGHPQVFCTSAVNFGSEATGEPDPSAGPTTRIHPPDPGPKNYS